MHVREVRGSDAEEIARVARSSLVESYGHFIDADQIDDLVDEWYASDEVADLMDDVNTVFFVADGDDGIVGFSQGALLEEEPLAGELHWLHVSPDARERGIGVQLLGRTQEEFEDKGATVLRGLVLAQNEDGTAFYEDHGFERVGDREVDIGNERFEEYVYEKALDDRSDTEVVEQIEGPDGPLYVNYSEGERGTSAPFFAIYEREGLRDRYGWFCGNCESIETAMDATGRIVCNNCGNKRKAVRWDAAYL